MGNGVGGSSRNVKLIASAIFMLSLVGCGGLGFLPHDTKVSSNGFQTYAQVQAAYTDVMPGATRLSDLPKIGFETATTPNVETLSYLGVVERFMPRNTASYDRLVPQVQACIEAQSRCSAFVFHPQRVVTRRTGNLFFDLLGFNRQVVDNGWSADVVLLLQDGRVVYKLMHGRPHIEDTREQISPLGPLQGLGNSVTRTASRFL